MQGSLIGAGGGAPWMKRYVVQSSDVLEDMRVNVFEEGSNRLVWYKERFLTDDEILEHIVENATSTILWSIHRPKRGWYIRLRTPTFPPGVFIPLLPVPQTSPYHTGAALTFSCRTNAPPTTQSRSSGDTRPLMFTKLSTDSETTLTDGTAPHEHSYPPTPPAGPVVVVVHPPSPRSIHAKLRSDGALSPPRALRRASVPAATITHFLLAPHSTAHVPAPTQPVSLFTRLMAVIQNNAPSHTYSFTLSPIPVPLPAPATTLAEADTEATAGIGAMAGGNPSTPTPLLTFHDRTPVWTARCSSGLFEMDERQCRALGVEPAFYVAAALTYLEFLQERESYLVAAYD